MAEEQHSQGVVGDGPAVRRVCDEGQPGLGRPGVFVPAVFVEAAGYGRYGFSCLTADWGSHRDLSVTLGGSPSPSGQEMRAE